MKRIFPLVFAVTFICPLAFASQHFDLKDGKWQQRKTYAPDSPNSQLQAIKDKLNNKKSKQAQEMVEKWLKKNPKSEFVPNARLLLGDAKVAQRYYYKALFDYEDIIRRFPDSSLFKLALKREYKIADMFVHGTRRLFLGMRIIPAQADGEEILIRIQQRAPGSTIGEKASILLADYYYNYKYLEKAGVAYDSFINNYPKSFQRKYALHQLIKANLKRFKGDQFDPTGLLNAKERAKNFIKEYPAAAKSINAKKLLKKINKDLGQEDLATARWYDSHGKNVSAALMYKRIIKDHPNTPAAKKSKQRLKQMDSIYTANLTKNESKNKGEKEKK